MTDHITTEPVTDVIIHVDVDVDRGPASDPAARERARWKLLARSGAFPVSADLCDIWLGNTRDVKSLDPALLAELTDSIASAGQQVPAIARVSPSNPARLEIVAGARRLTAIRQINDERSAEDQLPLIVDLRELDNGAAFKVVDAENRGRSDMSPLERARFYDRAIEGVYYAEAALAEALGLNKSTVNRTRAILRLPPDLFEIIQDPHRISAAQASQFMSDWDKSELQATLADATSHLAANGPAPAAVVFKALKQAVAPVASGPTSVPITHNNVEVGAVRSHKKGGLVIELTADARGLGWDKAAKAIGAALKHLKTSN